MAKKGNVGTGDQVVSDEFLTRLLEGMRPILLEQRAYTPFEYGPNTVTGDTHESLIGRQLDVEYGTIHKAPLSQESREEIEVIARKMLDFHRSLAWRGLLRPGIDKPIWVGPRPMTFPVTRFGRTVHW